MKRISFAAIMLLLASTAAFSQRIMKVEKTDGTTVEYQVTEVSRIYFEEAAPEPVTDAAVEAGLCPDTNHPHMIDLGNGVKWACCNVGASAPWEYGDYFAWGETQSKSVYTWDTYQYGYYNSDEDYSHLVNIGDDIAGTEYDAATANWGAPWRMPSLTQIEELLDNTTSEWTSVNGVDGRKFTGSNGGTIFLPAAGRRRDSDLIGAGSWGICWSSKLNASSPYVAYYLYFGSGLAFCGNDDRIRGHSVRPVSVSEPEPEPETPQGNTYTANGVQFTMVAVEGGTFQMGSEDSDAYDSEKPVHQVTVSSFAIGQTEVTQELWEAVMGSNPSNFKGSKLPVEKVSWNDCQTFITKLNQLTGQQFRLPTEAEWEFAARGGNSSRGYKYSGSDDIDAVAWYTSNSSSKTHEVATKTPNELGIYDMSGNVWEWCQDWYNSSYYSSSPTSNPTGPTTGSYRVNRGGCWYGSVRNCRVACRNYDTPTYTLYSLGLRLAL